MADLDQRVRLAAFDWLERQRQLHGDVLPRDVLIQGFTFDGRRVPLISPQQGIHKPAILDLPLSILTSPPSERKPRPYDDALSPDGLLLYRQTIRPMVPVLLDEDHPYLEGVVLPVIGRVQLEVAVLIFGMSSKPFCSGILTYGMMAHCVFSRAVF